MIFQKKKLKGGEKRKELHREEAFELYHRGWIHQVGKEEQRQIGRKR